MTMPVIDMEETGRKISALRKAADLSVAEVAKEFGLAMTYAVYKWESGRTLPTIDNLVGIYPGFSINIAALLK